MEIARLDSLHAASFGQNARDCKGELHVQYGKSTKTKKGKKSTQSGAGASGAEEQ